MVVPNRGGGIAHGIKSGAAVGRMVVALCSSNNIAPRPVWNLVLDIYVPTQPTRSSCFRMVECCSTCVDTRQVATNTILSESHFAIAHTSGGLEESIWYRVQQALISTATTPKHAPCQEQKRMATVCSAVHLGGRGLLESAICHRVKWIVVLVSRRISILCVDKGSSLSGRTAVD